MTDLTFAVSRPGDDVDVDVVVEGELDIGSASALEDSLKALDVGVGTKVWLHLDGLSFIDSGGIHALTRLQGFFTAMGADLVLVQTRTSIKRIIEIAGCTELFTMCDGTGSS